MPAQPETLSVALILYLWNCTSGNQTPSSGLHYYRSPSLFPRWWYVLYSRIQMLVARTLPQPQVSSVMFCGKICEQELQAITTSFLLALGSLIYWELFYFTQLAGLKKVITFCANDNLQVYSVPPLLPDFAVIWHRDTKNLTSTVALPKQPTNATSSCSFESTIP